MPTVQIPIELAWGYGHGSPGANVWHARTIDGLGGLQEVTAWLEDFYQAIAPLLNSTMTVRWGGEASGVGDDSETLFTSDPWTVQGTDPNSVAPPVLAMLCSWRAATGGRSGRGRTFIGPLAQSALESNGTPAEGARTTLLNAANALIENGDNQGGGAFGIYSRTDDVIRDFVSVTVPNDFAIMRSRRD